MSIFVILAGTAVTFGTVYVASINLSLPFVICIRKIEDSWTLRGLIRLDIFKEIS